MNRDIYADVILEPITVPEKINVVLAEVDPATGKRTGHVVEERVSQSLDELKRRLMVSVFEWAKLEKQLAGGETVCACRAPIEVFETPDIVEG